MKFFIKDFFSVTELVGNCGMKFNSGINETKDSLKKLKWKGLFK